jgi:hypothetical protein
MRPPRPRRVGAPWSRRAEHAIRGVLDRDEFFRRCRDEPGGRGCCTGGGRATCLFSRGRTPAEDDLDREQCRDGSAEGAGDDPGATRVQPAAVWTLPRAGLVVNPPWVLGAVVAVGCCCMLLGLERPDDLLGGRSVASGQSESVAAVELLAGLQLGERRAVDGEVVGKAERERGEVLPRLTGCGRGGRDLSSLALLAAFASVLEGPGAVGALGDRSVPSSAVVLRHRHPNWELDHHHLALDCSRNG